ncbi:MAG TPA: DUF1800 domain-containing protein [Gemmatimonadaceae bacterium]|jgi:uncharacterized protein (DUF1800 family)|nr:DUF1800 domain-containing protein [Gemmatimonadaceae bacterium]
MRRSALLILSATALASPIVAQTVRPASMAGNIRSTNSSAPADREQTADQQVLQVLNRLAFGPRPGDVATVRRIGIDAWIDQQLHPERIDDSGMDQLLARYTFLNQSQNDLAQEYADFARARTARRLAKKDTTNVMAPEDSAAFKEMNRKRTQLVAQLESARIARAVASQRQLLEVMTDFWENHFNVYVRKGAPEPYYLVDYDKTIREHALGKFRDLLGEVAHSPAMLFYLDNAESRANPGAPVLVPTRVRAGRMFLYGNQQMAPAPQNPKRPTGLNENYGRELLELHTLGVDGGYTQQDVINVARALTGWTIQPPKQGGGFIFRPAWHDAGEKVILGHTLPAGRGEEDGEDVLDILARSPATAHFIAFKLARRFVSDSPSKALIDRAAHTFLRTDGDIRAVVKTIITSPEFFAEHAYHTKVKSPFEVVVSAARALDAQPDTTARTALAVAYLGEPLFGHQAPDGWPETGDAWMNTGAILNRINFGMAVAANRLPGASFNNIPGTDSLMRASREQQVDAVVQHLLGGAVSPDMRKILLSGEHPLTTNATQPATGDSSMHTNAEPTAPTANDQMSDDAMSPQGANGQRPRVSKGGGRGAFGSKDLGPPPQLSGFAQVVGLAIGSPEFQRR